MNIFMRSTLILYLMAGTYSLTQPCSKWIWRKPLPQGNDIRELIHDGSLYWAVGQGGLVMSSEDGTVWDVKHTGTYENLQDIAVSVWGYSVVGDNGVLIESRDGDTWSDPVYIADGAYIKSITYNGGQFVVVGNTTDIFTRIYWENPWVAHDSSTTYNLNDVMFDSASNQYLAVGDSGTLCKSSNGSSWTSQNVLGVTSALQDIEYQDTSYVIVGSGGTIFTSTNLTNWSDVSLTGTSGYLTDSAFWNGTYYVLGLKLYASTDLLNFSQVKSFPSDMTEFTGNGQNSLIVGRGGRIYSSIDGEEWIMETQGQGSYNYNYGVAFGAGVYVVVGSRSAVSISTDGITWVDQPIAGNNGLYHIRFIDDRFIAVGRSGHIYSSANGIDWTPLISGTTKDLHKIAFSSSAAVVVGEDGTALFSSDLITWTPAITPVGTATLKSVAYSQFTPTLGSFAAVGEGGVILISQYGTTWSPAASSGIITTESLNDIIGSGSYFYAVGPRAKVFRGLFGDSWTEFSTPNVRLLNHITKHEGEYKAFGLGAMVRSSNGTTWIDENLAIAGQVHDTYTEPGRMIAVGYEGAIIELKSLSLACETWPQSDVRDLIQEVNSTCN